MGPLLFILVMLVLLWVLLIAPQRRRQQQQKRMLEELDPGDEILTAGGLYGTVIEVGEDRLTLELSPGTHVTLDRRAVAQRLTEDEPEDDGQDEDEAAMGEDEAAVGEDDVSSLAEEPPAPARAGAARPGEGPEEQPAAPRT